MRSVAALIPLLSFLPTAQAAPPTLAPWEPARGCYLGAYIELDGNCRNDIDAFETLTGRKHATYLRYVGYGSPFPYEWVADLGRRKCAAHIAWEPNEGLTSVQDDEYLRGWAEAAARSGVPIFLRYASEMNGTWQAYSGDPEVYKEKWRIVARVMREVAPNVAMVWCPFSMPRRTIEPYYPGDEFVDWVGVNIYSVTYHSGDINQPGGEDPRDELTYVYNIYADRKPIQICEYAATHFCAVSDRWVPTFAVLRMKELYGSLALQFPRVKMVSWFSVDTIGEGLRHNNYSVTDDETILGIYRELVSDPYFIDTCPAESGAAPVYVAANPGLPVPPRPDPPGAVDPVPDVPVVSTNGGRETPLAPNGARLVLHQPGRALSGKVAVVPEVGVDVPVQSVEIHVDGVARFLATSEPYRWSWDTTYYANGEHVLTLVVYDIYDGVATETDLKVMVDNG